jgi:hypothetical protein
MTERPLTQKHVQQESEGHFRQINLTGQNPTLPSSPLHPHPTSSPIPHPPRAGTHGDRRVATSLDLPAATHGFFLDPPAATHGDRRTATSTPGEALQRWRRVGIRSRRRPCAGRCSDDGGAWEAVLSDRQASLSLYPLSSSSSMSIYCEG